MTEATADVLLRGATFEFEAGSNNSAIYAKGSTIGLTDCTFTMDGTAASGSGNSGLTTGKTATSISFAVRSPFPVQTPAASISEKGTSTSMNVCSRSTAAILRASP